VAFFTRIRTLFAGSPGEPTAPVVANRPVVTTVTRRPGGRDDVPVSVWPMGHGYRIEVLEENQKMSLWLSLAAPSEVTDFVCK
jgi:hypothetical protein